MEEITPDLLLKAYMSGYFPMSESRYSDKLYWFNPEVRGVLPLDAFHVPRSLEKTLRKQSFHLRANTAFTEVIQACAEASHHKKNPTTDSWINGRILSLYSELHRMGYAFSVETYKDELLVGGLYGVSIGGAFFGESMFSLVPDASKVALVYLVQRLREYGYTLLDTQFVNDHLKQFGVREVPREDYLVMLENALSASPNPSSRFLTASPISS